MMTLNEVRKKYLDFFEARGHKVIPSASLVPENDPTTLFTGSGMQPLVPYLLGQKHPAGKRLVNSQKCFRSEDIEEVGDNRHTTFFEMLGNWSLGDYWKQEQLGWFFEFLTKELGIPSDKLWVTCFEGDTSFGLPKDDESAEIWKKLGIPKEHIHFYPATKNWWSRSGVPENMPMGEPGGPDSEVFYDFGTLHNKKFGEHCHPNCNCGQFMEIGNSVFMEYRKTENGFEKLKQCNVDFGGGLERITAAVNDNGDIFAIDVFDSIIKELERLSGKSYLDKNFQKSFRIFSDHLRAAVFLICDGVIPSNTDRGYFVRRLIRTTWNAGGQLKIGINNQKVLASLLENISKSCLEFYPEIEEKRTFILETIASENRKAGEALLLGAQELHNRYQENGKITSENIFDLYQTFGINKDFLPQLIESLNITFEGEIESGKRLKIVFDEKDFNQRLKKHQEMSRAGSEKKFKGGLADTSEMSLKYHTATHLLHQALRDVLGSEVQQKGSNITPDRLRFDFSFPRKMAEEEKIHVEEIVNEKIKLDLPVRKITLPLAEAKKSGALHFFDEKYPDEVLVHYIGDSL